MLERKQYNMEMDEVRRQQVREMSEYLSDFINLNANIREKPISSPSEEALKKLSQMEIPRKGRNPKEVGDELVNDILGHCTFLQHPRFMSLVASAVSPYSVAAGFLTEIYNPNAGSWELSPTAGMIEERLVKWMGGLAGFGENRGGIFTSGGSLSNLTCLIAARENKLPGRVELTKGAVFFSDQTHSSIVKGMRLMGMRSDQIHIIPSDDDFRIRVDLLEQEIERSVQDGCKPFLMVGNLGTTNTGTIDPFNDMSVIAKKYNMWLHADGAYGGSILFSDIYRNLAKGIEKADSLSWDAHKWAMQAYSCGCALVRDKQLFLNAFNEHPEYLADVINAEHNDGWDLGIEMSRPARCLKLWYTVQAMGTDLLGDVIDYSFFNSRQAEKAFLSNPEWKEISKPMCGTVNMRYEPEDIDPASYDELNAAISRKIIEDGFAYVLTTVLKGKRCIRLIVINGNTETEDVLNVVEKLNEIAVSLKEKYRKA